MLKKKREVEEGASKLMDQKLLEKWIVLQYKENK